MNNPEYYTAATPHPKDTAPCSASSELPQTTNMPKEYSVADKLAGRDLHGLACRIPKPTAEQAKCSHMKWTEWDAGYEDWDGEWQSDWRRTEVCIMEDIPGTNNLRCPRCGYTRRY